MSLADDRRGRVPFALVGVLLLVGSLVYAHGIAVRGPTDTDLTADRALDRAETTVRPVVRTAVRHAAIRAAHAPVVRPADTAAGRALDPATAFRDALRLRIYRLVADRLARAPTRVGRVTVRSSLPAVAPADRVTTRDVRAAIERVQVEPVRNGTAMRVTIHDVTHEARLGDRVLARTNRTVRVTVATPVLALHARTTQYERRLNRGPVAGPGLGRRLTGRLIPVALARGIAQHGGVGIANVVANRHVEVATNGAALALQRATFGRADPDGERALIRATARVGLTDVLATRANRDPWAAAVLHTGRRTASSRVTLAPDGPVGNTTVAVNRTADAAFVATDVDALLRRTYRLRVTRRVSARVVARDPRPPRVAPGPNWTATRVTVRNRSRVTNRRQPNASSARRTVRVTSVRRTEWRRGNATRTTVARWTTTYVVRLRLTGERASELPGPDRLVTHGRVWAAARDRLPVSGATADRLARRAVRDGTLTDRRRVAVDPPARVRRAAVRDLLALADRVRNVTVSVPRRAVATGDANPPRRLADRVADRRASLLDAPARYDDIATRARVAVRAAYLDHVQGLLGDRAARTASRNDRLGETLSTVAGRVGESFRAASRAANRVARPESRALGRGPTGRVAVVPEARPAYLTVTSVDPRLVEGLDRRVTPLAARNLNPFTVPYGDAAGSVIGDLLPSGDRVPLRAAARAAVASDRTLGVARAANHSGTDRLADSERVLRAHLRRALGPVDARARAVIDRRVGDRLPPGAAREIVLRVRASYAGPGAAALAAADGRYAARAARFAARRANLSATARERLAVHLRVALGDRVRRATVPASVVNRTVAARRAVLRGGITGALGGASERAARKLHAAAADRLDRRLPPLAGLPVAPVPGYWYATVNVWLVEVRGEYPHFVARARVQNASRAVTNGSTGADGVTTLEYVREASVVAFDADGDGDRERVGHNRPITFATRAVAFAVVPAGGGVGDATMDERSDAWGCPGGPACNRSVGSDNRLAAPPAVRPVLYDAVDDDHTTPAAVRAAYGRRLREAVGDRDPATVASETGVDRATVERFADGDVGDATLDDAARVLGHAERVASDTVAAEVRDQLLLGMSTAILDVDTVAGEIDTDLSGQEVQRALEGRIRLTLNELAAIHALIVDRSN